jgi:hypothetical protein
MDPIVGEENSDLELVVVIDEEDFESTELTYTVTTKSLTRWESIDLENPEAGLGLVRFLVLTELSQNPTLAETLYDSCSPEEFLMGGVPPHTLQEVPELALVNLIVHKMYQCLETSVIDLGIRVVH